MPTSFPDTITTVVKAIQALAPASVLDIGCGFGKYGLLCREYLDIWWLRYRKQEWRVRIDAVEAFELYLTPVHWYIYNNIYIGDIRQLIDRLDSYNVVLMLDVIEHFEKQEGLELLEKVKSKCGNILLSTPAFKIITDDEFGNPYQEHKSFWELSDFGNNPGVLETEPLLLVCLKGYAYGRTPVVEAKKPEVKKRKKS